LDRSSLFTYNFVQLLVRFDLAVRVNKAFLCSRKQVYYYLSTFLLAIFAQEQSMSRSLSRLVAAAVLAVSGLALTSMAFDADAARVGKGSNAGRQSSNVTNQAPAASTTTQKSATAPAAASSTAGAAAAAKPSGASRWLGPLAGIAAGLGIAALLSHFGLGGAMADFLVMALIAGVVIFGVMFILRRMRGSASAGPAMQGAGAGSATRSAPAPTDMWRQSSEPAVAPVQLPPSATGSMSAAGFGSDAPAPDQSWFIPTDFDTQRFLGEAKQQFVSIQKVWDSGNVNELRNFLTDDLLKELQAQLSGQTGQNHTEVVLLNAELLGIEKVSDGHLASVRFSGMLREQAGAEAFRFEEVWNLFKPEQGGWLLAGIQQVPVSQAS
jgi:predicted lipid-binding transport protein (Tim44 family)